MTTLKNERFKIMSNMNRYQDNNLSVGNTATTLGDKNSGLYYDGTNLYIGGGVLVGATPISNITSASGGGGSSFFISLITKNGQAQFVYPTKISDYNISNFSFPEILKSLQEGCLVKRDPIGGFFTKIKNPLNDPLKTVDESDLCIKAKNAKNAGSSIDTFRSNSLSMPIDSSTGSQAFNAGYEIKYEENGDIKNYISYHYLTIYDILKSLQSGELTKISNAQTTISNPFSTNPNNKSDLCIKAKYSKTSGYTKNSSRKSFSIGILKFGDTAILDSGSEQMVNFINDEGLNSGYSEGESFSFIDILVSLQTGHLCRYGYGYLQNVNNPVIELGLGSSPNPKFSRYLYDLDINARRLDNLTIHEIFDVLEQGEYQGRKIKVKSAYTAEKLEGS